MDFPFLFFSSPVSPPTPSALARQPAQAVQPTIPPPRPTWLHNPLGPSGPQPHLLPPAEAGRHHHCRQACAAATPKPPWPTFPLLRVTCSITPPPPDVISPLICGLNRHVKATMNTIKGRTFVLRCRPLPPPQCSIPAYKRHPPLPGPLHTLGHHSFALLPRFHELPSATSLPILPRLPCSTLWCVPCSINHRGRFSTSRSPSPDHSSDRQLDEAPPPLSTSNHRRSLSSPAKSYHSTAQS
jgi:hypothetical protein